jgi:hypothetical protein
VKIAALDTVVLANSNVDPLACDSAQDAVVVLVDTD